MKKEKRAEVWMKYDGRCAYCGEDLEYKNMQVDHIIPVHSGGANDIANYNPSCRQCNFYKSANTVDFFRLNMMDIHKRIMKPFISRLGAKYGIVQINEWDGIFYFEKELKKKYYDSTI